MTSFESIESVQRSIDLQKELLQTTDVSIKKVTGRSPGEERLVSRSNVQNDPILLTLRMILPDYYFVLFTFLSFKAACVGNDCRIQ